MFELNPKGYKYRPIKIDDTGWDVYAIQSALDILLDGIFGIQTDSAVCDFQEKHGLKRDGIVGVVTQRTLALELIWPIQKSLKLPSGLMRGQVEKESAFLFGNYSPQYSNKAYDIGIVQRNSQYATFEQAFHATKSLTTLGKQLREKYDKYKLLGKVKSERRLWELAAGSWNAPAWTDRLAEGKSLTASQNDWIKAYIDRVTIYLSVQ